MNPAPYGACYSQPAILGEYALLRSALVSALFVCQFAVAQVSAPATSPAISATMTAKAIAGTVTDSTGAIIPGAQVVLTDASGATYASAATDASGAFQIVPPHGGTYSLVVTLAGFQPSTQKVTVGEMALAPLNITLSVATAVQQVTVSAGAQVDLTSSENNGDTAV